MPEFPNRLSDMSSVLITSLREEYSNPRMYLDGEIFRQIRLCHRQKKIFQEMKWWACLRKDESDDLKRIIAVKELREGFDKLLDFTGLWDGFHIVTMRRYLSLKCHEVVKDFRRRLLLADRNQELSMYLRRIHHVWSKITSSNSLLMNLVDVGTVRSLESRAPAASTQDATFLRACMDSGKFFAQVLDPGWRRTIIDNICAVERTIPSLWTFLEDTKYLAPCAKAIKMPFELHQQTTIYGALNLIHAEFNHDQRSLVQQKGESHFVRTEQGDKNRFEFCYRQLWMYAMRHSSHLVSGPVMWEHTTDPPCDQMPMSILWYRFAQLAFKLGFRSRRITLMGSASALDKIVLDCISWVAGAAKGGISPERQVAEVRERLQIETDIPLEKAPSLITEDQDLEVQNRLGHYDVDYPQKAKLELFVRWLYDVEEPRGKYITPSFVRRAMFHAFFGHNMRSRDKVTIVHEQNETNALPVLFPSKTHSNPWRAPELGDHHVVNRHPSSQQGSADQNFTTFAHVNSPSDCIGTSPRGEERGFQKTRADSSSATGCQNAEKEAANKVMLSDDSLESSLSMLLRTAESATPAGLKANIGSPLSTLTLAQPSDLRQSILESSLDNAIKSDAEKKPSSNPASSSFADSEELIAFDDFQNTSATIEQDPTISERSYWSSALTSHYESGQEKQNSSGSPNSHDAYYPDLPMPQIEQCESIVGLPTESMELVPSRPRSSWGRGQETLKTPAITKASTKRIREIVEESLSCVHDCAKYSATVVGRKSRKRSFQEYSACLESVDTQEARTVPK